MNLIIIFKYEQLVPSFNFIKNMELDLFLLIIENLKSHFDKSKKKINPSKHNKILNKSL